MVQLEPRILIVEDEATLAEMLAFNLQRQGFAVRVVGEGYAAVREAQAWEPNLILLDVMLPGLDGFEVCRRVRASSRVPILMLTARGEEIDRVMGLEIGADDYLTKPFGLRELLARVRALLRRAHDPGGINGAITESNDLRVSTSERRVWKAGVELVLRPQEYALLTFLIANRGLALTRRQILDGGWGTEFTGDERTVDVHIRALREMIEDDPANPTRISTVRGIGYRFEG